MVRLGFFSHSVQDVVTKKYHNFQETSRSPQNFNFFKKISITDRPIFKLDILPKSVRQREGRGLLNTPEWKRRLADWKQNGWTAQSTRVDPNPTVQGERIEGVRIQDIQPVSTQPPPVIKLTENLTLQGGAETAPLIKEIEA